MQDTIRSGDKDKKSSGIVFFKHLMIYLDRIIKFDKLGQEGINRAAYARTDDETMSGDAGQFVQG